jgi:hypothetical protein
MKENELFGFFCQQAFCFYVSLKSLTKNINKPHTVSGMSWVVTVPGTISTPAPTIVQIGPSRMSMSCGRWSASVMTLVMPLAASGCSRVRAPAAPIWKSATYEWRARPICCLTSPYAILSSAPAAQGTLRCHRRARLALRVRRRLRP